MPSLRKNQHTVAPVHRFASIGKALAEPSFSRQRKQVQQGGATGTPFYDIELTNRYGKKLTLGRTLRNKEEADWLVAEMRRIAGLQTRAASASF